jgi:flavin-binding protein dodecin
MVKEESDDESNVCKTEVVGCSSKSISDAIEAAIVDVRGSIRDNKVTNYQVTLKLGLRYEPKS